MSERAPGYMSGKAPGADTLRLMAMVWDKGYSPFERETFRNAELSKPSDRLSAGVFTQDRAAMSDTASRRALISHYAVNHDVADTWSKTARWAASGENRQTFNDNMKRELEAIVKTTMKAEGVDGKLWDCKYGIGNIRIPWEESETSLKRLTIDKPLSAAGSRSVARATDILPAGPISLKITVQPFKYDTSRVRTGREGRPEHWTNYQLQATITAENGLKEDLRYYAIESVLRSKMKTGLSYPVIMAAIGEDINKYGSFVREKIESFAAAVRANLDLSEKDFSYDVVVPPANFPWDPPSRPEGAKHSSRQLWPSVLVKGTVEYTDELCEWLAQELAATSLEESKAPEGFFDPPEDSKHSLAGLSSC